MNLGNLQGYHIDQYHVTKTCNTKQYLISYLIIYHVNKFKIYLPRLCCYFSLISVVAVSSFHSSNRLLQ